MTENKIEPLAPAQPQLTQLASARARVYGILSAVYAGLPGEHLVKFFSIWCTPAQFSRAALPPGMVQGLKKINSWLEKHGAGPSALAALETEFTRLLRGLDRLKSPPPPYESGYL